MLALTLRGIGSRRATSTAQWVSDSDQQRAGTLTKSARIHREYRESEPLLTCNWWQNGVIPCWHRAP